MWLRSNLSTSLCPPPSATSSSNHTCEEGMRSTVLDSSVSLHMCCWMRYSECKERQGQKLPEQHFTTGSEVTFLLIVVGMTSNDAAALELDLPLWPPPPRSHVGQRGPKQCPTVPVCLRATWQQPPPELVSIKAMYSAPFSRFPLRAANFLLLGYTNCTISILYWAATGS